MKRDGLAAGLLAPLLLAGCAAPAPEAAGGCRVAHVATLPLLPGRFTVVEGALNRRPAALLLDTGAEGSAVAEWAVGAHRLERLRRGPVNVSGIGGVMTVELASARVGLGGDEVWRTAPVLDLPAPAGRPVAALLGVDVLARYDLEVSFPEKRARLWETQGCGGRYALWGGAYWSVPIALSDGGRPLLDASVNGQAVPTMLDTGASSTTLQRTAAIRLGVTEAALEADPAGSTSGVDGTTVPLRRHRFPSVGVGPERFDDQPIAVAAMRNLGAEMLLGTDWMRDRRIWLSFRNRRLFVQPASAIRAPDAGTAAAGVP